MSGRIQSLFDQLGSELDQLQASAVRRCPPDQVQLVDANFARAVSTFERLHTQVSYIEQLIDRCDERSRPHGNVHPLRARRRRR